MKKMVLVLVTIFSLMIFESKNYQCKIISDSFLNIENIILNDYIFVQNGIKVEYTTNGDIYVEQKNILNQLSKIQDLQITELDGSISAFDEYSSYNITLYQEDKTRVEIVLINSNDSLSISDLRNQIEEVMSNNCIKERYFSFIKGKQKSNSQEMSIEIMDEINKESVQSLDISNGTITKALLKDGTIINLGQINYNTGEYLIIGTPVIFTTY